MLHNPLNFVRDFYFFHRSTYPQLKLTHVDLPTAEKNLRRTMQERIYFLHDELTRLPSFPRKALETSKDFFADASSQELYGMEVSHKLVWSKLIHLLLRGLEYAYCDLNLFINVINGVLILHCENVVLLRHCLAFYIEMAYHFRVVFSMDGFFFIMPTILRCFSKYQTNPLLCDAIKFTCKQFYIMHRKPFVLQMFGSVANILDLNDNEEDFCYAEVKASHFYELLASLENLDDLKDHLDILSLVKAAKPLKAIDLCYRDDPDTFSISNDAIASCITICAYAPDSRRAYQMLVIMQAIVPQYLKALSNLSSSCDIGVFRQELTALNTLVIEMKTLITCCDVLSRNFAGPQKTFDLVTSGAKRSTAFDSPRGSLVKERSIVIRPDSKRPNQWEITDDVEVQREMFRKPRDALLCLVANFLNLCSPRLKYLSKVVNRSTKIPEILDNKSFLKLAEIAHSLLKLSPYDPNTLGCEGLQLYFLEILPVTDWSAERNRSALSNILRRLDKTIAKIVNRSGMRRRFNWDALSNWLLGLHKTLTIFPYVAHLHFLKTTIQMCLKVLIGDHAVMMGSEESTTSVVHTALPTVLAPFSPPQKFLSAVIKLASFLMQALGVRLSCHRRLNIVPDIYM
ncbi:unnamed protein product [Soboliphyme baturini]|uniref:PI3K/PI4K domain-containing protein n=1 Tax=Soboliphyme baturini TaxID=241478 RepID=A0A183IXU6_9BILA|nr:unnamed protein product [Soboliphyme baturini]